MKPETYNGWTNYATWRVNLEIFDGWDFEGYYGHLEKKLDPYFIGEELKYYVEDWFEQEALDAKNKGCDVRLMYDYASSFLSDVNWTEIASSMIESYKDEQAA